MSIKTPPSKQDVYFNYNGESWEAHEVLAVPKEADISQVKKTYERRVNEMGKQAEAFLTAALNAILKSQKK